MGVGSRLHGPVRSAEGGAEPVLCAAEEEEEAAAGQGCLLDANRHVRIRVIRAGDQRTPRD